MGWRFLYQPETQSLLCLKENDWTWGGVVVVDEGKPAGSVVLS
jgi:hypothetical protein